MIMNIHKEITIALVLLFFTSVTSAGLLDLEPGWPRLVDNNTKIKSKYKGITAFFEAENKQSRRSTPYFKAAEDVPRMHIDNPEFKTWADIRVLSTGLEVLDGVFEVYGSLEFEGIIKEGLAFSASLIDVAWDDYTIVFKMEKDQQGYLCDLGFCSFANELLSFNLTSDLFDGDFTQNISLEAQTVATVPIPPAVWLFGTAMLGLVIRRPNTVTKERA